MADSKTVSDIMAKVNQAEGDITAKRDEWLTYYRMYRGYREDTLYTGRSAVSVPVAFEWVEVVTSRLFDIFAGRKPYLRVKGREAADDIPAKGIQAFQNWQYETARYRRLIYDILHSIAIFGTGIAKVYWKYKEGERTVQMPTYPEYPELGTSPRRQTVPIYDNICFDYVDPFDFNVDPEAATIDDAMWCSHKVRRSPEYVEEMARRGIYRNVQELLDEHRQNGRGGMENDSNQQTILTIEGHKSDKSGLMHPITITEYWEDDHLVTIGNGKHLLRDSVGSYQHGRKPFVVGKIISVPQEFWGISLIESGAQSVRIMEDLLNNGLDNFNFAINQLFGVNELMVEDTELVFTPGKVIHTRGNPADIIFPIKGTDVSANIFNFYSLAADIAKRVTGVNDYMTGQSAVSRTATEASLLTNEAAKRIGLHIHAFGDTFVGPLAEMVHETNRQFVTADKVIRVTGNMMDPYQEVRVTPDVFGANVDFIWESEDRELNNMVARQEMMQAMTIAQANPALWLTIPILFYKFLETYGLHENDELMKAMEMAKITAGQMMFNASMGMMNPAGGGVGLPNVQKFAGGSESNINQSMQKKGNPQAGSVTPVK